MSDSPVSTPLRGHADAVTKKLFNKPLEDNDATTNNATSPFRTRVPWSAGVNGRGSARQWAEQVRGTRASPQSPAAALSPHVRTASEMEPVKFGASLSSDSVSRVPAKWSDGQCATTTTGSHGDGPQARVASTQSETASATDSATRRYLAQRYLHQRGTSTTSNSHSNSRAETPASTSRTSSTNSRSLAGRSPRRSTYLENSGEVSEADSDNLKRHQRVERVIACDRESSRRHRIVREEGDEIKVILLSYKSFQEAFGLVPRTATLLGRLQRLSRSSTPYVSGRQTPNQLGKHRELEGMEQRPPIDRTQGDATAVAPTFSTASSPSSSPAATMTKNGSPRSPRRPTMRFNGDDTENGALAQLKFVSSHASLSREGPAHSSPSQSPSQSSSPLRVVPRASSIEVEKAYAFIDEAEEMRRQSLPQPEPMRRDVSEDDDDADGEDDHFFTATSSALPALVSTMKLLPPGALRSPHTSTGVVSPRSTAPHDSPRRPRVSRSQMLSTTQPPHASLTSQLQVRQGPLRGYDPSIQYVIVTYPSFYWVGQSRWFQCTIKTPLVWLVKLALVCVGVCFVYALIGFARTTVKSGRVNWDKE